MNKAESAKNIAMLMLDIRGLKKLISTYYESVETRIYPDNCVHPTFNQVSTSTGRSSCNNPNVQNSPTGDNRVAYHFISRFKDGLIISADYKGIEPRVEAQLSDDPQLIKDIISGIDSHTKNLALKERVSYECAELRVKSGEWVDRRKKVKNFTFAQQYGAGNRMTAKNSGLSMKEVKDIKEQRQIEYPKLFQYYSWLQQTVNKDGSYTDPWGRFYKFNMYEGKNGYNAGYSFTEIQNYRTQGFATATIVLSMTGKFWREKAIHNRDKYLMINTVHDSLVLDVKKEFISAAKKDLTILTDVDKLSKELFNYEFKVPIEIDIKFGNSWGNCS